MGLSDYRVSQSQVFKNGCLLGWLGSWMKREKKPTSCLVFPPSSMLLLNVNSSLRTTLFHGYASTVPPPSPPTCTTQKLRS